MNALSGHVADLSHPIVVCSQNKRDGNRESIAWKDFCEDVGDAMDTTNGRADALAATRGAVLDLKNLI